jgi:nucleotidyltransferase AbiEii toxin of type IV toxin-antitoxin system
MDSPGSVVARIQGLTRRERRLIDSFREGGPRVDAEPEKLTALVDTARALDAAGIPYALIGGLAVGVHSGTPRATLDVDVAASAASGRANAVTALVRAGLRKTGEFAHSVNFRHPSGEPVQVAFDPAFDVMIARAESFELGGTRVRIVTRDDLIAMKERAAADPTRRKSKRLRDQADVELLRGDVPDPDEGW